MNKKFLSKLKYLYNKNEKKFNNKKNWKNEYNELLNL